MASAADRVASVVVLGAIALGVVVLAVLAVGLVGLTDKLSAAVFSKNRVLLGVAIGGLALLTSGYLIDRTSFMWIGAGLLALLALFLLAAG